MKFTLPLAALAIAGAAAGIAGGAAVAVAAQSPAPAAAKGVAYWDGVHWDDDDDDDHGIRTRTPLPLPNAAALKRVGMVRVTEVERDDGYLEIEGYDANGYELDIRMDARGQRVLSVHRDTDRD